MWIKETKVTWNNTWLSYAHTLIFLSEILIPVHYKKQKVEWCTRLTLWSISTTVWRGNWSKRDSESLTALNGLKSLGLRSMFTFALPSPQPGSNLVSTEFTLAACMHEWLKSQKTGDRKCRFFRSGWRGILQTIEPWTWHWPEVSTGLVLWHLSPFCKDLSGSSWVLSSPPALYQICFQVLSYLLLFHLCCHILA